MLTSQGTWPNRLLLNNYFTSISLLGFCKECWDNVNCAPEMKFIHQYTGNKTAALIECKEGTYLYIFEVE